MAAGIISDRQEFNFRNLPREPHPNPEPSLLAIKDPVERLAKYHSLLETELLARERAVKGEATEIIDDGDSFAIRYRDIDFYKLMLNKLVDVIIEYESSDEYQRDLRVQRINQIKRILESKDQRLLRLERMKSNEMQCRERTPIGCDDYGIGLGNLILAMAEGTASYYRELEEELTQLEENLDSKGNQ